MNDIDNYQLKTLNRESRLFAQKAARSMVEVEHNVNNIADIMVLLDVLGYNNKMVSENGFENLHELAKYMQDFLDVYDDKEKNVQEMLKSFSTPVPAKKNLISESIGLIFPWLGSLILLFTSGVSLWMAWGLPPQITTAFLIGVFLGLGITEGLLQTFGRLFTLYYRQKNIGEVKTVIKRSYKVTIFVLAAAVCFLYLTGYLLHIPFYLVNITSVSIVSVSIHRISYMAIYAWKKLNYLIFSYSAAFAGMILVFYSLPDIIGDATMRYFVALGTSFTILTIFAIHNHFQMTSTKLKIPTPDQPHFFRPGALHDKTIKSRFHVQFWETMPYFLFGTLYFSMIFVDRIMSWIFNPHVIFLSNGLVLPMAFNSVYHMGADMALFVLLPVGIIQYIMMNPIYLQIENMSLVKKANEAKTINQFIRGRYRLILWVTVLSSGICSVILYFIGPLVFSYLHGSETSVFILHVAIISNIILSVFIANSLFIMLLNRTKVLAILAAAGTVIICLGTLVVIHSGFENIIFVYLGSAIFTALASTIYVQKVLRNASSIYFAKYL